MDFFLESCIKDAKSLITQKEDTEKCKFKDRYKELIKLTNDYLENHDIDYTILFYRGLGYLEEKQYTKAISDMEKAHSFKKTYPKKMQSKEWFVLARLARAYYDFADTNKEPHLRTEGFQNCFKKISYIRKIQRNIYNSNEKERIEFLFSTELNNFLKNSQRSIKELKKETNRVESRLTYLENILDITPNNYRIRAEYIDTVSATYLASQNIATDYGNFKEPINFLIKKLNKASEYDKHNIILEDALKKLYYIKGESLKEKLLNTTFNFKKYEEKLLDDAIL